MERKLVEEKYKWDLSKFISSEKEYNQKFKKMIELGKKRASYKGKLEDKAELKKFLKLGNEFDEVASDLCMYVENNHNVNLADTKYIELGNVLYSTLNKIGVETSFVVPELTNSKEGYLQSLIEDPDFKNYAFEFKDLIRTKKHVLSEKEEKILSSVGSFCGEFSDIFESLTDVDFKFEDVTDSKHKKHKLTESNFSGYLQNSDRMLRKTAFENLYKQYNAYGNTVATNYMASCKKDWFGAQVRGFKSVLEAKLYPDDVNKKVYENLTNQVEKNLPLLHKYYDIKKAYTGIDDFCYYDMALDLAKAPKKDISYEQCVQTAKNALSVLGEEYLNYLERCINERWVDVYPTENKRGGAYQTGCYGRTPVILLNFEGKQDDIFTFVHEFGHANHTNFANANQPRELADYTIMLAEVASTVNEVLLLKYLYKNAKSNSEKLYLLDKYLRMFKSTLFRQTMFSMFEDYAHNLVEQNKPISKEKLTEFYGELNKKFHGKSVKFNSQIAIEWMRIPHFYSSYYVYKYSTGFVSAINLADTILNGGKAGLEKYLKFLSSGGSDYSVNILKTAGVDLTKEAPYKKAFAEMQWALNELEKLTK